ncbi:hypothetical protein BDV11DRAFT_99447 [Aspergillus similis]
MRTRDSRQKSNSFLCLTVFLTGSSQPASSSISASQRTLSPYQPSSVLRGRISAPPLSRNTPTGFVPSQYQIRCLFTRPTAYASPPQSTGLLFRTAVWLTALQLKNSCLCVDWLVLAFPGS